MSKVPDKVENMQFTHISNSLLLLTLAFKSFSCRLEKNHLPMNFWYRLLLWNLLFKHVEHVNMN